MVTIKQQFVRHTNRITTGENQIRSITIHETGNVAPGAHAQAHANLQSNGNSREASWHYQIDDQQVIQSFPDTAICWHAGKGNSQSIGVEICVNSDGNYKKALENTILFVGLLMARYQLNENQVVQHHFWTGKDCPHFLRRGTKGMNWGQFIAKLKEAKRSTDYTAVLKYGQTGDQVTFYQKKLQAIGYKIDVDGSFGPAMLAVVRQFQQDYGLDVDGLLGPKTQGKLKALLSEQKGEADSLNLTKNERAEMARIFKYAREKGIFSSAEHEKAIIDGTMTLSRLQYLQTIIAGAGINNGKRIMS